LPNIIKIDTYNSELHRFKVGPFLRHSVVVSTYSKWSQCPKWQLSLCRHEMTITVT